MKSGKKKHRKSFSLFVRYTSSLLIIEVLSLSLFGVILTYFVAGSWKDEQKQLINTYVTSISDTCTSLYADEQKGDETSAETLSYAITGYSGISGVDVFITDTSGNVVYCIEMAEKKLSYTGKCTCIIHSDFRVPGEIYTGVLAEGKMATISNFAGVYSDDHFVAASVIYNQNTNTPVGIVFATQPLNNGLKPYLFSFLHIYIPSAAAILFITAMIIYIITYNMTKPLKMMSEATKRYSRGDFSYKIDYLEPRHSVREFDELSAALNSMAESLETLEKSRTNFVANVSHELKTPMTTIGGFIDGMLDGTIDKEHEAYYLKIVSDEVKRLSRLVVSMLNMSKMESGEMRINPVQFNLTEQLLSIFISFEQKIEDKHIHVKGLNEMRNNYIEADRDMINQVFYNLVDNAVKFTEEDGEISVIMGNDGENVTVHIRNTGKGIDSEDIDHVFERFYKGDKSRSLDARSAGLGLFIVKNIVELHNGNIEVKNVDNKYTEFTVKLKNRLIG